MKIESLESINEQVNVTFARKKILKDENSAMLII
jgi:hypothetical protein